MDFHIHEHGLETVLGNMKSTSENSKRTLGIGAPYLRCACIGEDLPGVTAVQRGSNECAARLVGRDGDCRASEMPAQDGWNGIGDISPE